MFHLNPETEDYLEKLAYAIRQEYLCTDSAFDLQKFTDAIPCEIIPYSSWETGSRPAAIKIADTAFQIKTNPSDSLFTKLTTICHVFLHMGFRTDRETWNRQPVHTAVTFRTDAQFWQASYLALAILMPRSEFESVLHQNTDTADRIDLKNISTHFHVPYSLAHARAERLHIIRTWPAERT